jgi:hypothetical protein
MLQTWALSGSPKFAFTEFGEARIEQGRASFGVSRLFILALFAQRHKY